MFRYAAVLLPMLIGIYLTEPACLSGLPLTYWTFMSARFCTWTLNTRVRRSVWEWINSQVCTYVCVRENALGICITLCKHWYVFKTPWASVDKWDFLRVSLWLFLCHGSDQERLEGRWDHDITTTKCPQHIYKHTLLTMRNAIFQPVWLSCLN